MDPIPLASSPPQQPAIWQWTLGFLLVGIAWGFTTPFIRKGAVAYKPAPRPSLDNPEHSWLWRKILKAFYGVWDLLRSPKYAIPLVINLTGSVWFFLIVGQADTTLHGALGWEVKPTPQFMLKDFRRSSGELMPSLSGDTTAHQAHFNNGPE
ncbi:MAG: hypothetical protein LQ340_000474 [Diploschistes diacapsis]|nr:MAG: hypothetical protein LQ340_000474 [Diploschistes diacapsis]